MSATIDRHALLKNPKNCNAKPTRLIALHLMFSHLQSTLTAPLSLITVLCSLISATYYLLTVAYCRPIIKRDRQSTRDVRPPPSSAEYFRYTTPLG